MLYLFINLFNSYKLHTYIIGTGGKAVVEGIDTGAACKPRVDAMETTACGDPILSQRASTVSFSEGAPVITRKTFLWALRIFLPSLTKFSAGHFLSGNISLALGFSRTMPPSLIFRPKLSRSNFSMRLVSSSVAVNRGVIVPICLTGIFNIGASSGFLRSASVRRL
jgi:hypothetical protein